MSKIWIARHGSRMDVVSPDWKKTAQYPVDPPLCPIGIQQAKDLGEKLKPVGINHIFASPFLRILETAHYVAEALDLPIKAEAGLYEWLNPEWFSEMPQLVSMDEKRRLFPRIDPHYKSGIIPTQLETAAEFADRAQIVSEYFIKNFPENTLLISHGAIVYGVPSYILGAPPHMNVFYCCLYSLSRSGQTWKMDSH